MSAVIRGFFDGLDWSNSDGAHFEISEMLRRDNVRASMLSVLARARDQDIALLAQKSHETSTHYKWFVGAADDWRWQAWVHQYKEQSEAMLGYANTPHNHRYWFTSLIISGGFQNVIYRACGTSLTISAIQSLAAGDSYVMSPDQIHSLRNLLPGTMTLIIRGRAKYPYSTEYRNGGKLIRHYPMRTHLTVLRDFLADMDRKAG